MKLIKCHIDGFGAFSHRDFDFEDTFTSVLEENGFGKTTLSQFLKAMFYGLDRASSKFDERKKYTPWSASEFGGSLTFLSNGKSYTVIRSFGKVSASQDTVSLVLTDSGKSTDDYDIASLGESLFGIDKEGFMRSTFSNGSPNLSTLPSSIRSQIGVSQEDGADDMGSYEKAEKNLGNAIKELEGTSSRKKGKIAEQKQFVMDTNREILDLEKGKTEFERLESEKEVYLKEQNALKEKKEIADRLGEINVKLQNYNNLLLQIKGLEENNEKLSKKYNGKITKPSLLLPLKEKISQFKGDQTLYNAVLQRLENSETQALLETFEGSDLSNEKIGEIRNSVYETVSLKRQIDNLSEEQAAANEELLGLRLKTVDNFPSDEELLNMKSASVLPTAPAFQKRKNIAPVIALLSALTAAGLGFLFVNFYVGLVVMILSAVSLMGTVIFAIISKTTSVETAPENSAKSSQTKEILERFGYSPDADVSRVSDELKRAKDLFLKINQAKNSIDDLTKQLDEKIEEISKTVYCFAPRGLSLNEAVNFLQNGFSKYENQVVRDIKEEKRLNVELKNLANKIKDGFLSFGIENVNEQNFESRYEDAKEDFEGFERNSGYIENYKTNAQNQYESNHLSEYEGKEFKALSDQEREALSQKIEALEEQINIINSAQTRIFIGGYDALCDEIDEKESKIAEAEKFIEKAEKKLTVLKKTLEFLTSAKTAFSKKYAKKVTDSFKKYSKMFSGSVPEEIMVSPELEISAIKKDAARNIEGFSMGQKSVMDVCLRLSLIDAMFEKEKPFLILDDPFISLDEKNFENAKSLIKEASKQCQIIYLTCHKSREIKGE